MGPREGSKTAKSVGLRGGAKQGGEKFEDSNMGKKGEKLVKNRSSAGRWIIFPEGHHLGKSS